MSTIIRTAALVSLLSLSSLAGPQGTAPAGEPVPGLTQEELARFLDGKNLYDHDFTPQEGLGPLYNEQACSTCHGAPAIGGFDPEGDVNNVMHFTVDHGPLGQNFQLFEFGGAVLQKRTIATNFVTTCNLPADSIPTHLPDIGISSRHTPAVFGFGLLDAIRDQDILEYEGKKPWKKPGVLGAANWGIELEGLAQMFAFTLDPSRKQPIGAARVGRFGWKAPTATLFQFTTEPFNIELGVSTPFFPRESHPNGAPLPPECVQTTGANDSNSQNSLRLYYFQAFLAAPEPAPMNDQARRGEQVFGELGCDDCHRKSFKTGDYYAPLPDGTPAKVEALSNKRIEPYSDLLVHDMGDALADQRPQGRANGRMWRTTPLWGVRFKTRLLHNGSVSTVDDAIKAHAGEGSWSRNAYLNAGPQDRAALLEFLNTL